MLLCANKAGFLWVLFEILVGGNKQNEKQKTYGDSA